MTTRVGFGFDAHAFADGETQDGGLMLGGVRVPFERSLAAHSDGDVLLHALCDALLGAAALGDLGTHYPNDEAHRGIAGRDLLKRTMKRVGEAGFVVVNADVTVVAERPRVAPFVGEMRALVAAELGVALSCVNVKATTTDGLGFTGRGEGVAAFAVASVVSSNAESR